MGSSQQAPHGGSTPGTSLCGRLSGRVRMAWHSLHGGKDIESRWLEELHDATGWADTHTQTDDPLKTQLFWHWNISPPCWLPLNVVHSQPCHVRRPGRFHSTRSQCVVLKWSGSMRRCCAKQRRDWGRFETLGLGSLWNASSCHPRESNSYVVYIALT